MNRKPDIDYRALEALLRHVFGSAVPVRYERTSEGISTQVYRIEREGDVFYLRVAEEREESLAGEAELLRRLKLRGVHVPDVVYMDPFEVAIGRSILIMTEIRGAPLASSRSAEDAQAVARRAGCDLALLNQVPVTGFGWVRHDGPSWPLRGELPTYAEFVTSYLPEEWPGPLASLFTWSQLMAFEQLIGSEKRRGVLKAHLAHGDFDVTHIFQKEGVYTGLIDFGEIRGADPYFDLGHFHLHDCETFPVSLLPALIQGCQEVVRLPADYMEQIRRSAILLGLRQLSRWIGSERRRPIDHRSVKQRAVRLGELLAMA